MKQQSPSSNSTSERCQHRTRTGRQCRSLVSDPGNSFCAAHADSEPADSQDFSAVLTERACRVQNAQGINHSLGALYTLLAQGRISPRRASVLAHISGLLLRSLAAIDHDRYPKAGQPGFNPYDVASDDLESETEDLSAAESASQSSDSAAPVTRQVPPGKEPLPATAAEFAAAVLKRQKPN